MVERGDPLLPKPTKNPKPNKDETTDPLCSDIPEWLQEFRENLVDEKVPENRDSHASSSHEVSLEPTSKRSQDLGKHSVRLTSLKTEIARSARGRKLQGLRAEDALAEPYLVQNFFGDLITADHKVLSEGCESRHNNLKSFTLTIPWNLAKLVQIFPGIIVRQHHTDQKQMGLLKEHCAE